MICNFSKKIINKKLSKKLIMTLLVKNEDDIVEECIKFHLASGVDHIIATNNNSTDNTRNILKKYEDLGVLTLIDEFDNDFNQVKWVNRMINVAIDKHKADWIINVDADEFWFSRFGNIKLALPQNHSVVYVNGFHVSPPGAQNEGFSIRRDMRGYIDSNWKVIHKSNGYKLIDEGNHDVKMKIGHRSFYSSCDIIVYHFWIRSYPQYERKIINTFKSIEEGYKKGLYSKDFGSHVRLNYELYQNGQLFENYKRISEDGNKNVIIDNRLYDFINNNYKCLESIITINNNVFNNKTRSKRKNKFEKILISCQRRINEIKNII